jgi:hypothetical protein
MRFAVDSGSRAIDQKLIVARYDLNAEITQGNSFISEHALELQISGLSLQSGYVRDRAMTREVMEQDA